MRASGIPLVRMQALSADAMAKKLFLDEGWPADVAVPAAKAARGDWHQLHAHAQLCSGLAVAPEECSGKDATLATAPPCFVANQLLNGTAPEACPLGPAAVAWTERNLALHCDDVEVLAQKQEALAAAATGLLEANPVSEELFKHAARFKSRRVQYAPGAYASPWQKDEDAVRAIEASFRQQRRTPYSRLKEMHLEAEACVANGPPRAPRSKAKPKATAKRALAKSAVAPK